MTDKLEALSQPVAWVLGTPSCKHLTADKEYADWYLEHGSTASQLYSQEYVTALLAALKLEKEQSAYYERHMWHFHGLAESETKRAEAAEQRLQQPIKLPEAIGWKPPSGRDVLLESEVIEALNAAGHSVVKP